MTQPVSALAPQRPQGRRLHRAVAATLASVLAVMVFGTVPATAGSSKEPAPPTVIASASSTIGFGGDPAALAGTPRTTLAPPDPCDEMDPECVNEPANCHSTLGYTLSRGDNPEFGGTFSGVSFNGYISCYGVGYVYVIGSSRLVDRASETNGTPLASGAALHQPVEWGRPARSSGAIELYDADYPAGSQAEVIFAFTAQQEYGVWNGCGPASGGIRIIRCDGAGTPTLTVEFGTGTFSTNLVQKTRGGCNFPWYGYHTLAEENGYAVFGFWGTQICTGRVHVKMTVALARDPNGEAIHKWEGEGVVTQGNPLNVGKGAWLGSHVRVGETVKITITTVLTAPGAATWTSNSGPSHFCFGDGTDVLNCTDTFPKFKVPKAP